MILALIPKDPTHRVYYAEQAATYLLGVRDREALHTDAVRACKELGLQFTHLSAQNPSNWHASQAAVLYHQGHALVSVPLRYKGEKTWGQVKAALDGLDWESVSSMAEHRNALIEMWSVANHGRVTQANQVELEVQLVDLRDHLSAAYENTITTEYNPYVDTYKGVKVPEWSQVVSRLGCPNILEHLATVIESVDPSHKMLKRSLPEMCSLILWNPQEILKERAKELHAL